MNFIIICLYLVASAYCNCNYCNLIGTIGSLQTCDEDSGLCNCRPSVTQQSSCNLCYPEFYNLSAINVFGCQRCSCDVGGSLARECDPITGQCRCRAGIAGKDCDRPNSGTFIPALYHIHGNLVIEDSISGLIIEDEAEINGVIEPDEIQGIPPRFELLFNEYPIPISFEGIKEHTTRNVDTPKKKKRKGGKKNRQTRSFPETLPISKMLPEQRSKREEQALYVTDIEFSKPGTYFLVLNYTASLETAVEVELSDTSIPAILPQCLNCLVMLAGSLGVKGIEVARPGQQVVRILTPASAIIHYIVALPKQYYFTSSLKQDVSPRCNIGPFTELCNWYKYPITLPQHHIEEAESWLSPVSEPAYTDLTGVNLFGSENNVDSYGDLYQATSRLTMEVDLQPGTNYYMIIKYYKPYHYSNYEQLYSVDVSLGVQAGKVELVPCPWEEGCRAAVTGDDKQPRLFSVENRQLDRQATLVLDEDFMVFIDSVMFIRQQDWSLDLVQAQWYCVQGPDGECLPAEFIDLTEFVFYESESAIDAIKMELEDSFYHGTGVLLLDPETPSLSVVFLENTIPSTVPERYVVVVHYYKYTDGDTYGTVDIDDENDNQGDLVYKFCPSASGCRVAATTSGRIRSGVVSHNPSWTGQWTPLIVTGGDVVIIVRLALTQPDSVYIDYLSLVPLADFTPDMLYPLPLDHGPIFTQYCAYHYLYLNPEPGMEEYCEKIVFTMTTMFNNGSTECKCSAPGSLSDVCDQISGTCRCKPGYTGRTCDQCEDGYFLYGFYCRECLCEAENSYSVACDKETGQCDCEQNFKGRTCTECNVGYWGYDDDLTSMVCDKTCDCDQHGSSDVNCDLVTGQCSCNVENMVAGRACDICAPSHYRFPACYPCQCDLETALDNECDVTGNCTCKEGYAGELCTECSEFYYYNGTTCAPCTCSDMNTPCTSILYYPYQVTDDMSSGYSDYILTDMTGSTFLPGKLSILDYNSDPHVLMVDLSDTADPNTYIRLPRRFTGDKRAAHSQTFSYDVDVIIDGDVTIVADTIFQGRGITLLYSHNSFVRVNERTRVKIEIPLSIDIPLYSTVQWRVLETGKQPSDKELQAVLTDLGDIRINAKVFEDQIVAMIDNIELGYLSTTPNTEAPLYGALCTCNLGYQGDECEYCAPAYFRNMETDQCDEPCQCSSNKCTEDGRCLDCGNGSDDNCASCRPGSYYATNSQQCEPCSCSTAHSLSDTCTEVGGLMTCNECEEGYAGITCEECDNGYYGNASSVSGCQECPCNNNLNLTIPDACHPITASCDACISTVSGSFCDKCAPGYHGNAVTGTCAACGCFPEGSQSEECDARGRCRCRGNVEGTKCDKCRSGYYVSNNRCRACECADLTSTSSACDAKSGQCPCKAGFGGRQCEDCGEGYYPYYSDCLDCECSVLGSTNSTCDQYGECTCKDGYYGDKCAQCDGYYVNNDNKSCSVCGDCPVILLEMVGAINRTIDLGMDNVVVAGYQDKIDKLTDKARQIEESLPTPDNLSELLGQLGEAQVASAANKNRADEMVPKSQEGFVDASDLLREAGLIPANVTELEDELRDLISDIQNFNLAPDVADSGEALDRALDLIEQIEGGDVGEDLKAAKAGKKYAKNAEKAAEAAVPDDVTIPTIVPLPARMGAMERYIEDQAAELDNLTGAVQQVAGKVTGLTYLKRAAEDQEGGLREKVGNLLKGIPVAVGNNDAVGRLLDDMLIPDINPLKTLVQGEQAALLQLAPLVKARHFNCSGLDQISNITGDSPGPTFVREMRQYERDLRELRRQLAAAEEDATEAKEKVDEFSDQVADSGLELSTIELSVGDVEGRLGGLVDDESAQEAATDQINSDNTRDRARLDAIQLPNITRAATEELPDAILSVPESVPLQERIDRIEPLPELVDVSHKFPDLVNKTNEAERGRTVVVEGSKSIDYRLRSLWDKIEKARRNVETILIPMRFDGQDSYARYETSLEKSAYLSVKATIRPEEDSADGGIVYLGPDDSEDRFRRRNTGADYVEVGLSGGYVVCTTNIDNEVITLEESTLPISKDAWTTIHVQRIGGYINLSVNDTQIVSKPLSTTSAFNANNIVVGKSTLGSLKGSITDVYINGERVSQWLSEFTSGLNRSVWAPRMISDDKDIYYLDGDTSYLAFKTLRSDNSKLRTTSVNIKTASEDGLIMFYGEIADDESQDIFAMDLYQGALRLHYTDAAGQLESTVVTPKAGSIFSDLSFKDISAYVRQGRSEGDVGLRTSVGSESGTIVGDYVLQKHSPAATTYFGRVPDDVQEQFASVFAAGKITSVPFTGCMKPWKINNKVLKQSYVSTARNVKNGCPDKLVSTMSLKDEGMAELPHTPLGDISFGMASETEAGTLLYAGNGEDDYVLIYMMNGRIQATLTANSEHFFVYSNAIVNTGSKRYIRMVMSNTSLSLYVDDVLEMQVEKTVELFTLDSNNTVRLGVLPTELNSLSGTAAGYTGCISELVIGNRIYNFAYDTVSKENVILDRCRVIKSTSTDDPDITEAPSLSPLTPDMGEIAMLVSSQTCRAFQTNTAPDSFFFYSTSNERNYVKIDNLRSNKIVATFTLELKVSTLSEKGVLFYTRSDKAKDILLKFDGSGVTLVINLGREPFQVVSDVVINDGRIHKVTVIRQLYSFTLVVDDSTSTGLFSESTSVPLFILDDNGICIAGAPDDILQNTDLGFNPSFVGCISDIRLNQIYYSPSSSSLSVVGQVPPCLAGPELSTSHYFNGAASIVPDIEISGTDLVEINFQSSRQTGLILTILDSSNATALQLTLNNTEVLVVSSDGSAGLVVSQDNPMYFCDGVTHTLRVQLDGTSAVVSVDEGEERVTVAITPDSRGLRLGDRFTGCMEDPLINGVPASLSNPRINSGVMLYSCPSAQFK